MNASLDALVALQALDSAIDAARKRLADIPTAERSLDDQVGAATAAVDAARERMQASQQARRALEKDVAAVDTRLARFDDHRAAIKTNQEYTALLHEISTAKGEKSAIEDKILVLMEEADALTAAVKAAETAEADTKREAAKSRDALGKESTALEAEIARLSVDRARHAAHVDARALATYEQLLKNRRGIAVARLEGEICGACHVRLRPHVLQIVKRGEELMQCDSCQRILYASPVASSPDAKPVTAGS